MTNLSHRSPAVLSLQSWHMPVCRSQVSVCPLHLHGLQLGKSQWPGWHSEHCRPKAPFLHGHCPVNGSHCWASEPSRWQSQAKEKTQEFIISQKHHIVIRLSLMTPWQATYQCSHRVQNHRFLVHTGYNDGQLHWVYMDTDRRSFYTQHSVNPEDHRDKL